MEKNGLRWSCFQQYSYYFSLCRSKLKISYCTYLWVCRKKWIHDRLALVRICASLTFKAAREGNAQLRYPFIYWSLLLLLLLLCHWERTNYPLASSRSRNAPQSSHTSLWSSNGTIQGSGDVLWNPTSALKNTTVHNNQYTHIKNNIHHGWRRRSHCLQS